MTYLSLLTPTNILDEKNKFFASPNYHPQFTYDWDQKEIDKWLIDNPKHKEITQALLVQDNKLITTSAIQTFHTDLDSKMLSQAKEIVKIRPTISHDWSALKLAESFETSLSFFEIDYKVEISDRLGFNIRPDHKNKKLVISKHLDLQFMTVQGEVRHELIHIIRSVNGKHNSISPTPDYLPTEEGLASYFMDFVEPGGSSCLFQHAAEYVATEIGLNGSFRDIFDYLISIGFNPELAWQRGIRHKYGFKDTSMPGDIIKPAMYFHHEMKIKDLSQNQILRLLNGKYSIKDLSLYNDYRGVVNLDKIKEFYSLN